MIRRTAYTQDILTGFTESIHDYGLIHRDFNEADAIIPPITCDTKTGDIVKLRLPDGKTTELMVCEVLHRVDVTLIEVNANIPTELPR